MARVKLKAAKEVLALIDSIPAPTSGDIAKARVAALSCKSTQEFADFFDVQPIVIKQWRKQSADFDRAISSWRDHATQEVEAAIAKRAIGFTKKTNRDIIDKNGVVHTLINETYYPPSETAAQFWLKNRAPNDWQDKKEIDVNLNANIRAWLVSAGGQLDPSEIIDGVATEVIKHELEDHTQELLEAELVSDLIEEVATETEVDLAFNLSQPENNSSVSPSPGPGPSWQALNSKWT